METERAHAHARTDTFNTIRPIYRQQEYRESKVKKKNDDDGGGGSSDSDDKKPSTNMELSMKNKTVLFIRTQSSLSVSIGFKFYICFVARSFVCSRSQYTQTFMNQNCRKQRHSVYLCLFVYPRMELRMCVSFSSLDVCTVFV